MYAYLGKHLLNITATFSQFFFVGQNTKQEDKGITSKTSEES